MPMVQKKPTKRDNVGDLACAWKMVYVAPRDFEELKTEVGAHFDKLTMVGMTYAKQKGSEGLALLVLLQASEVGRMIGRKLDRKQSAVFRRMSKACFG